MIDNFLSWSILPLLAWGCTIADNLAYRIAVAVWFGLLVIVVAYKVGYER